MIWAVSLVILLLASDASCQTVVTYSSKPSEELLCPITGATATATWSDETSGTTLAGYERGLPDIVIVDPGSKHVNFNYSASATSFSLFIQDVEAEDGGVYRCVTSGGGVIISNEHTIVVEVIPETFSLDCFVPPDIPCPEKGVNSTSELVCVCAANGVRPGTLYLDIPDAHTAQQNESIENGNLFDLRLNATVPVTEYMAEVTCCVKGYNTNESIPSELITTTFMISQPTCGLDISFDQECKEATLTCSCTASPTDGEPPSGDGIMYSYFNGTGHIIETGTTTTARTNYVEAGAVNTYSCRGCNGLYYGDTSYVTNSSECTISTTAPLSTNEPTSTKAMGTTTVEPESKSTDNPESGGLGTGAIVGISLGALAVVIVIVVIALMMFKPGMWQCGMQFDSSYATDGKSTVKDIDIYEDELSPGFNEVKTDGKMRSNIDNGIANDGMETPPPIYAEMKKKSNKQDNNGVGPVVDPEKTAGGVFNVNTVKDNDPNRDPRSSMRNTNNSLKPPKQTITDPHHGKKLPLNESELQYAALDHGTKTPSDEFRKPTEEQTVYATTSML